MKVRTRSFSRASACILATLTAMAGAAPVRADTVTVTAKGAISAACSMTSTKNFGTSNINAPGTATATAGVTCNQTFKMNVTSTNGAIKSSVAASAPFTNTLNYSLKADIALDDNSVRTATCGSATLKAGQSSCALSPANTTGLTSNGQIATGKTTTLTVSWTPPAAPMLLKPGSYSDTITLNIAVIP